MTVTLGDTLILIGLLVVSRTLAEIRRLLLERRVCTCQAAGQQQSVQAWARKVEAAFGRTAGDAA